MQTSGRWRCSECGRTFGRIRQSHVCLPAGSLERWLETRPTAERGAVRAVLRHLERVGPIVIEAVEVGVLVKRVRTFVEMRPKRRPDDHLALSFIVSERIAHPRITRTLRASTHRFAHFVELRRAADVDATLRDWLAEAYLSSSE